MTARRQLIVRSVAIAAVYTGTSGCRAWNVRSPSGHVTRHTNLIDAGPVAFTRSTAATAELPVASIGSTTIASRPAMVRGTLK